MHPVQKVSLEPCFSIAEIIHPPHRCGISRCWLDSMIIAQVCLRLATIKGHSKMCSFAVLGGSGGGGGGGHAVVYADPEHPKHAQWVTWPVSMLAMQELGCFQLSGIVYRSLQHGVVHYHAATWGDGRGWMTQQLASVSHHSISVHSKCHRYNAPVFVVHNIRLPIP